MRRPLNGPHRGTERRPHSAQHAVRRILVWSCTIGLVFAAPDGAACADAPVLVRFVARSETSASAVAGILLSEDAQELRVLDLETLQERSFPKKALRFVKNPATEQDVASIIGVAPLTAWTIANSLPNRPQLGRIASVDGAVAYINLGKDAGLAVGERLGIFRDDEAITDPESGEILGNKRRRIAQAEVTEVREKVSKIRPLGDFEVQLEIGDVIRPVAAEHPVAVLPFGRDSGQLIQGGVQLAEQVTSSLSKNGVVVVERTLLNKVLQELSLAETGVFDLDTARKVGKLLQAYAVVSGTIQVNPRDANVNVRLIELETGRILYATSLTVKNLNTTPVRSSVSIESSVPITPDPAAAPPDSGPDRAVGLSGVRKRRAFVGDTAKLVRSVRFSPDGTRAVSGGNDTIVRVWDLQKGVAIRQLIGHTGTVNAVTWLPDGQTIVSGDYHSTIKIWNVETGQELASLRAASDVRSLAIAGDGDLIVSGSRKGRDEGHVQIWSVRSKRLVRHFKTSTPVWAVAVSPDGQWIASAGEHGDIELHSFRSGYVRPIWRHKTLVTCITFSNDGHLLLANEWDGAVRIWDVESGEFVERLPGFPDGSAGGFARFTLTRDDVFLLATGHEVRIWRMDSSTVKHSLPLAGGAVDIDLLGERILIASGKNVELWTIAGNSTEQPAGELQSVSAEQLKLTQ